MILKAKVKTAFPGRPDGETVARTIAVGETVEGDLARVAVDHKWAEEIREKPAKGDGKK